MAMKNDTKGPAGSSDDDMEDDYAGKQDAQTLQDHAAIHADPDRLQNAMKHLSKMKQSVNSAHSQARKSLYNKTGKRLKDVFGGEAGEADGGTPFEKAAENH